MKHIISYFTIITAFVLLLNGCSELEENLTQPVAISVHGVNSMNIESENFHGKLLTAHNLEFCKECHASDFTGGTAHVACNTVDCHPAVSVHKNGILNSSSDNFHGKFIQENNLKMDECAQCHGDNYQSGIVAPTCTSSECHPAITVHKDGILILSSDNFHGKYIQDSNWKLDECAQCHGANYESGIVAPTCNSTDCHPSPNGPEACNTCHGDFSDPSKVAPPTDLDGNIATSSQGVGAHTRHLYNIEIGKNVGCYECHPLATGGEIYVYGHIDGQPAEMEFDAFTNSGASAASYDYNSATCSNTYCHGNFEFNKANSDYQWAYAEDVISGNSFTPVWNIVDGSQSECGTCHGLPPTGHIDAELTWCVNCHPGVVDANGNIIDKLKHLNGESNVFGN